jgi:hypothetical protein
MPSKKFSHALQMHWNPPGIVYVVYGIQLSGQFCLGIKNIRKNLKLFDLPMIENGEIYPQSAQKTSRRKLQLFTIQDL